MYEPLAPYESDFNDLQKTLTLSDSTSRIDDISKALNMVAQSISETSGKNDIERDHLKKLYLGLLAASRVIVRVHEEQAVAHH